MYGLLAMASNTVGQDIVLQKLQIHVQQRLYTIMNVLPIETLATLKSAKYIL